MITSVRGVTLTMTTDLREHHHAQLVIPRATSTRCSSHVLEHFQVRRRHTSQDAAFAHDPK